MKVWVAWVEAYADGSGNAEILGVSVTEDGAYAAIGRKAWAEGSSLGSRELHVDEWALTGEVPAAPQTIHYRGTGDGQ